MKHSPSALILAACAALSIITPCRGDEPQNQMLQEVVVTAQKREQSVQDVPLSMTVFTGADLDRQTDLTFQDYAGSIPNLSISYSGDQGRGNNMMMALRGVASTANSDVVVAGTTGYYIGDTPLPFGVNPRLVDINRIEVLRGPQGTLYGSESMGGTIKVVPNEPDLNTYSAWVRGSLSDTNHGSGNESGDFIVNVPLIDGKLGVRVSAYSDYQSGIYDRFVTSEDKLYTHIDTDHVTGAKAALRWLPQENFEATFTAYWQKTFQPNAPLADYYAGNFLNIRDYNQAEPFNENYYLGDLTLRLNLGFAELVSSSSYYHREFDEVEEQTEVLDVFLRPMYQDPTAPPFENSIDSDSSEGEFSEELHLTGTTDTSRLKWLVGAFTTKRNNHRLEPWIAPGFSQNPEYVNLGTDILFLSRNAISTQESALFSDVTFSVTDRFRLGAGLRYFDNSIGLVRSATGYFNGGNSGAIEQHAQKGTTPRFGVEYDAAEHFLLYSNIAKGFRLGGVNPPVPQSLCGAQLAEIGFPNGAPTGTQSDSLWSYEVGAKRTWLDGQLVTNGSVFYINWKGIPQSIPLNCGYVFDANIAASRNTGAELEISSHSLGIPGLELSLAAGYVDAVVTGTSEPFVVQVGDRIENVPRWTGTGSAQYTWPVGHKLNAYVRGDEQFAGESFTTFSQTDPLRTRDPYQLTNLRAGVTGTRGVTDTPWEVALFVTNVFDRAVNYGDVTSVGIEDPGRPRYVTNRPRTIGVTGSMKFQ
jgi:iron complex outermembrane recepter protein